MTNKTQAMLTIALTLAVTVLLVDRIIEPAQAQDCATTYEVEEAVRIARRDILDCLFVINNDTLADRFCRS
jgi:ABC-type phosphate transport system ATPase subunit